MTNSIIEIAQDGKHLSLFRGFLKISESGKEIACVPLDGIHALILNCHQATLSQNILLKCTDIGIPVILCSSNHQPAGILWPVITHHKQAGNIMAQLNSTKPLAKQLWKQLVQSKINGQYQVLNTIGGVHDNPLAHMARRVKSGDDGNMEAQAARRYWSLLMGKDFTRNPDAPGANSLFNYGYAILRSMVARAVISVGLNPSIGVFHKNRLNAFCLVDDLMEPYRPTVDYIVFNLIKEGKEEINRETKVILAGLAQLQISMPSETTTINNAVLNTAQSLAQSFNNGIAKLILPKCCIPKNISHD